MLNIKRIRELNKFDIFVCVCVCASNLNYDSEVPFYLLISIAVNLKGIFGNLEKSKTYLPNFLSVVLGRKYFCYDFSRNLESVFKNVKYNYGKIKPSAW